MDTALIEERFHAAVDIIKSLPKTGCIQPSNETKLKFYSYFKQATEGPCELPKPSFWEVVNRAKWDAWNKLGNMSKQDAMTGYVEEFVKIVQDTPIETLDDPSMVNEFLGMMGPYIEYAPEEIKLKHKLMNGKAGRSLNNNNSEDYVEEYNGRSVSRNSAKDTSNGMSDDGSELYASPVNGHSVNGGNESDSDIFSDTLEGVNEDDLGNSIPVNNNNNPVINNPVVEKKGPNITRVRGGDRRIGTGSSNSPAAASGSRGSQQSHQAGGSHWSMPTGTGGDLLLSSGAGGRRGREVAPPEVCSDVNEQLAMAVIRLQHTMEQMVVRLDSLETLLKQNNPSTSSQVSQKGRSGWSIFGMSPKLAILIFTWPLVVQLLMLYIRRRQRRL